MYGNRSFNLSVSSPSASPIIKRPTSCDHSNTNSLPNFGENCDSKLIKPSPIAARIQKGLTKPQLFEILCRDFSWIASSPEDSHFYVTSDSQVYCNVCRIKVCGSRYSNVKDHGNRRKHQLLEESSKLVTLELSNLDKVNFPVENGSLTRTRQMFTLAVMKDIPKGKISTVYSPIKVTTAHLLQKHGVTLGSGATIDRDYPVALKTMEAAVTELVRNNFGAIVIDGASTKFLGGTKLQVLIFSSTVLPKPLLLATIIERDGTAAVL